MTLLGLSGDVDEKLVTEDGEQTTRRRQASRVATYESAEVHWEDDMKVSHKESVNLVNASAGGLAYLAYGVFKLGQKVTVRTERYTLECVVRHVESEGSCRCVGVEAEAEQFDRR